MLSKVECLASSKHAGRADVKRCEGKDKAPCKRCRTAKVDCIFDRVGLNTRRSQSHSNVGVREQEELQSLQREVQQLRGTVCTLLETPLVHSPQGQIDTEVFRQEGNTLDNFSRLADPFPARQASLTNLTTISNSRLPPLAGSNSSEVQWSRLSASLNATQGHQSTDFIGRGLISESYSRELFESIFDTFDSLRARSVFCLAAILSVSGKLSSSDAPNSCRLQEVCQVEAQRLAAETLFEGCSQLETVQGMIILAAYSKSCWYLIGHAVRLAQQLQLYKSVPKLLSLPHEPGERFMLIRQARVWMTLAHLEQEIASGTGRHSLTEQDTSPNVRSLVENSIYPGAEYHIIGAIEILRLRTQFQAQIASYNSSQVMPTSALSTMTNALNDCLQFWDSSLKDMFYPEECFQRSFLIMQRNHAEFEFLYSYLRKVLSMEEWAARNPLEFDQILSRVVACAEEQLLFLMRVPGQAWYFRSSPVHSSLTITSITVISLTISKTVAHLNVRSSLIAAARGVKILLVDYPFADYHHLPVLSIDLDEQSDVSSDRRFPQDSQAPYDELLSWKSDAFRGTWSWAQAKAGTPVSSSKVTQDADLPQLQSPHWLAPQSYTTSGDHVSGGHLHEWIVETAHQGEASSKASEKTENLESLESQKGSQEETGVAQWDNEADTLHNQQWSWRSEVANDNTGDLADWMLAPPYAYEF
ncbi:hypothetical protein BP6252_08136 [Coleophoma cylindrospora]|uniref:Xylanolytic transcriptional activator regulatory domain-containing protein n=1 Tax=Coleophoma cylindrospora TaxID=1849047 RepID=A0A3D8RBZ1_9HELO|nr:hypothetical protein BP6252_08136 [Coleophoma cylindrospora]